MFDLKYHRLHIFHKDILHLVIQLLDHHLKDLGKQFLKKLSLMNLNILQHEFESHLKKAWIKKR